MVNNVEVTIFIKSKSYRFYYSYNNNSSFLDLLEYFSYLFPELELCQCYGFQVYIRNNNDYRFSNYKNNNTINIENNSYIKRYSEYLSCLVLIEKRKNCNHYNKNYLKYPKTEIISLFEEEIDKLKSNNDYQTKKIKNLNKEKDEIK